MNNILIIDDLVPLETQNYIEQNILNNKDLPWFFYETTCSEKYNHKDIVEGPQFVHNFFNNENGVNSKYFKIPNLILDLLKKQYDDVDLKEYRIKTNLQLRSQISNVNKHTTPHIDYDFEHQVFLYYVNDCDGDTIMYKERYDPLQGLDQTEYYKQHIGKATVDYTITPRENQMAWFDGLTYHSSNSPTNAARRFIINVNYTARDQ